MRRPLPDVAALTGQRPYVVLHPGASVPARAWSPERCAAAVAALAAAGRRVVVTGAPAEAALTAAVAGRDGVDLGGRTSFAELAAVLAGADAVVVGNTGPAHLAAAVGTPVVSLFAPVVPAARWAPYGVPTVLLGDQQAPCRDSRARTCPVPGHPCLDSVTAGRRGRCAVDKRGGAGMKVLIWHVHGAWRTAFVQGAHDYLVPVVPDRGPDGRGRAATYPWPATVTEIAPAELAGADVDVVVLQRPRDLELADAWLGGRRVGVDVPAVYVEHNCPRGDVPHTRHPLAGRDDIPIVHVTHFNQLMWDTGRAPTTVIEHGIPDPGPRYTGELPRAAVVVNEPARRGRLVGADLLPGFAAAAPLDVFGMGTDQAAGRVTGARDLPQAEMHAALARRRVYLHPFRWTSLGLSLIEAMHLGMPVVAVATTEAVEAVPPAAGAVPRAWTCWSAAVRHSWSIGTRRPRPAGSPGRRPWPGTGWSGSSTTGTDC